VLFLKKKKLLIKVVNYGIGIKRFVYNVQIVTYLMKIINVNLLLNNVKITIKKGNVFLALRDIMCNKVSVYFLPLIFNLKILVVKYGIGKLKNVFNAHINGI